MKRWTSLAACWVACLQMGAGAQDLGRPRLTPAAAADYTVAAYLAQGPAPWIPVDPSALRGVRPDAVVAPDGSGTHTSLQAALDAAPAAGTASRRFVIGLAAGTYRGQVCLQGKAPVELVGLGLQPSDVRIVAARYAGEKKRPGVDAGNPCMPTLDAPAYGAFSSASLAIFSNDVQVSHLTIENDAIAKPSKARLKLATGPQSISQHVVEFVDSVNFLASRFKIVLDAPKE